MNKEDTVKHMISYIENAERDLQVANFVGEVKSTRSDVVNAILNELEREIKDED